MILKQLNLCIGLTNGPRRAWLLGDMPPVSLGPRELSCHTRGAVVDYRWRPRPRGRRSQNLRKEVVIVTATGWCHSCSSGRSHEGAERSCVRVWTIGGAPSRWELIWKQDWGRRIWSRERERESLWCWHLTATFFSLQLKGAVCKVKSGFTTLINISCHNYIRKTVMAILLCNRSQLMSSFQDSVCIIQGQKWASLTHTAEQNCSALHNFFMESLLGGWRSLEGGMVLFTL